MNTAGQPTEAGKTPRWYPPVIGRRLRHLLVVVFILFGLLAVNSLYLVSITVAEAVSGELLQEYFTN